MNGACTVTGCDAGFFDCNGSANDGCEADLKSLATCTTCSNSCLANQMCTSTGCASSCPAPNTYCNGSCVNLATTPDHCGSCTNACADPLHGVATCANNTCGVACDPGYMPVNGKCVDQSADPTCCGTNCASCPAPLGGEARCFSGVCGVACPSGMTACTGKCVDLQRDVSNCNACGIPCAGICTGGICDPTAKQIIAIGASPTSLAADGTSVFWINNGTDIMQVARDGSSSPIDLAQLQQGAQSLVLDSTSVYWVNNSGGGVWRATKGVPGATFVTNATAPTEVRVNSAELYWTASGVFRMSKGGGTPTAVPVSSVDAVDDNNLFYEKPTTAGPGALEGIFRADLDGSNPVQLAVGPFAMLPIPFVLGPNNIAYNANHNAAHYMYTIDKTGGNQLQWQFNGLGWAIPSNMSIDTTYAFFMLSSSDGYNGLDRVPLCGGPAENISSATYANQMAIDDLFVYTVDSGGAIHRTAK